MNMPVKESSLFLLDELTAQKQNAATLTACTFEELLKANLPEPKPIIPPLLFESDLCMVYGWRGAGKTWFSLYLSYCIAAGVDFLGWPCIKACRVLVLDGEMRASRLKKRLAMIANALLPQEANPDNLHILTRDMNSLNMDWPDIGKEDGRTGILALIEQVNPGVIILDNISAWVRSGKGENDEESWRDVASLLMLLRAQGRAVVLIHHSGKGGVQRGTSKREDILDTVIALKKPTDYEPTEGLRVEVVFEKSRNLDGGDIPQIEVSLSTENNQAVFMVQEAQTDPINMVHALIADGASRKEIEQALSINRFQLMRLAEKAQKQNRGFILPDNRKKKSKE
ncbi:MAG: AAA family ATPase [Saezia sp.]